MKKRKIGFTEAVRFDEAMDLDQRLNNGLLELTKRRSSLTEQEYTEKMLRLFREAGLELTGSELRTLLRLRLKTGQMLLEQKGNATQGGQDR